MTSNPADVQDIVERLREIAPKHPQDIIWGEYSTRHLNVSIRQAADEIERLRAALQQSRSAIIEECAKVAKKATFLQCDFDDYIREAVGREIEAAIRALAKAGGQP